MFQQISNLFLKRKIYFDEMKTTKCGLVLFLLKYIVCKDDEFSTLTATKFINENIEKCTMTVWLLLVKTVCGIELC